MYHLRSVTDYVWVFASMSCSNNDSKLVCVDSIVVECGLSFKDKKDRNDNKNCTYTILRFDELEARLFTATLIDQDSIIKKVIMSYGSLLHKVINTNCESPKESYDKWRKKMQQCKRKA